MSAFVCKKCGSEGEGGEPTNPPKCPHCGEKMLPVLFTENGRDAAFNDDRCNALNSLKTAIRDVGTYYRYWCRGYIRIGDTLDLMRSLLTTIEADTSRKEASR